MKMFCREKFVEVSMKVSEIHSYTKLVTKQESTK